MRYYVIINGVNSLTIEGLAIRTLPPISKPAMRNLREEIDGRDGDITTELGYGAYDKTLEIGLYGDYDINKIISFFNSKGTIIFSDEPDKYYNFEIVDKIDYTKLVKFRTATINIHCQPFKYPVSEEPQVEEYEYVEGTGEAITLDNTAEAILNKIELIGNAFQDGTPTPDAPIPINVVSGDNTIDICGKNLYSSEVVQGFYTADGNISASNTQIRTTEYIEVKPNTIYTFSNTNNLVIDRICYYNSSKTFIERGAYLNSGTFTTLNNNCKYIRFTMRASNGSNITPSSLVKPMLEKSSTASTYEPYIGNTYPIYLGVENLFDGDNINLINESYIDNTGKIVYGASNKFNYIKLQPNTTYHLSQTKISNVTIRVGLFSETPARNVVGTILGIFSSVSSIEQTFTTTNSAIYLGWVYCNTNSLSGYTEQEMIDSIVVNKGTQPSRVSFNPIELCKIGTYQDYIYKDNGSWYLHKEIGKVVLNGSETNWSTRGGGTTYAYSVPNIFDGDKTTGLCTHWNFIQGGASNSQTNECIASANTNTSLAVFTNNSSLDTLANFKTWLGVNKPSVYYILATPTNTLIEDTTLIEQLEALWNANSYRGQTNITQTSNDLPFMMEVSALKLGSDHLIISNGGNIFASPTISLEGTGVVDIYLNDVQILEADLTETNNIVIDTESMEAYNPDTNALANRQVTGDYSKIKLEPGENDLRFSGDLSKATVTKYKRWL